MTVFIAHRVIQAIQAIHGHFLQRARGTKELDELADIAVVLKETKYILHDPAPASNKYTQ